MGPSGLVAPINSFMSDRILLSMFHHLTDFGFCTKYEVLVCTYVDPDIAYPWIIPYSILNDHEVIEFHISESKAFGMS